MRNFPAVLYVIIDNDVKDTICDADPRALALSDDTTPMARYKLVGIGEIVNESKYIETQVDTQEE